ncbi:MAG: hypothetical protein V1772_00305 [Chloroflexota bacterium]
MGIILFVAVALIALTAVDAHLWPSKPAGRGANAERRRTPRRITPRRRSQRQRSGGSLFGLSVRDSLANR